jgi:hypothetical protein
VDLSDEATAHLLEKNPSYLAYSRVKFSRLLYQHDVLGLRIDSVELRRTLRVDKGLGDWLKRVVPGDGFEYSEWLLSRLQMVETADTADEKSLRQGSLVRKRKQLASSILSKLEKEHGQYLADVESAIARSLQNDDG